MNTTKIYIVHRIQDNWECQSDWSDLRAFRSECNANAFSSKCNSLYRRFKEAWRAGNIARDKYNTTHPDVHVPKPIRKWDIPEREYYRDVYLPWLDNEEKLKSQRDQRNRETQNAFNTAFDEIMSLGEDDRKLFNELNLDNYAQEYSFPVYELDLEE